ncbi:MAG: metal ABC transporter substrate-binding protein [Longimicrobiales bacterium]
MRKIMRYGWILGLGLGLGLTPEAAPGSGPVPTPEAAPVRVVATLPVYADIVRQIGGAEVEVSAIADPHEDAHFVRPKPSFALDLRRADLFITTGLDLELWVPALLDRAGNAAVTEGGRGYVTAYTGIELRDVPTALDRARGDIHAYGNPHVYTDPLNALIVARNITTGLGNVAPERAAVWQAGLARFEDRIYRALYGDPLVDMLRGATLEQLSRQDKLFPFLERTPYEGRPLIEFLGGWLATAEPFRGQRVICYHKNWAYFEHRFQVECAGYIEAKPGIPPTPGHVADLLELMREERINVLIAASYFGRDRAESVASRAGARLVMMPLQPGAMPGVDDYFDMIGHWVDGLAAAFRGPRT